MKIELEVHKCLCSTKIFKINNIEASAHDFGEVVDTEPFDLEDADEYDERRWSCGNAKFIINMDTWHVKRIMSEYKITREQYREIAELLEINLSFGSCGYCL